MILGILSAILVLSYILGSIPTGYYLTKRFTGLNILKHGSGNIGSTNVKRIAGKKISIITQFIDMLKGLIPVGLVQLLILYGIVESPQYYIYLVALATIIGHDYSLFLKFKGGKGVNTTLGASLLIAPIPVFVSVAIYYLFKWRLKYVSIASILLGISLPITSFIIYGISYVTYYLTICTVIILIRHKTNIHRLINRTEPSSNSK